MVVLIHDVPKVLSLIQVRGPTGPVIQDLSAQSGHMMLGFVQHQVEPRTGRSIRGSDNQNPPEGWASSDSGANVGPADSGVLSWQQHVSRYRSCCWVHWISVTPVVTYICSRTGETDSGLVLLPEHGLISWSFTVTVKCSPQFFLVIVS